MVAHVQDVAVISDVLVPDSVGRVVLEKVSQAIERHQVVRRHNLDVTAVHCGLGEQHPDPAETIYAYSYGHFSLHSLACHTIVFCPKSRKIMQHGAFGSKLAFQPVAFLRTPSGYHPPPPTTGPSRCHECTGIRDGTSILQRGAQKNEP